MLPISKLRSSQLPSYSPQKSKRADSAAPKNIVNQSKVEKSASPTKARAAVQHGYEEKIKILENKIRKSELEKAELDIRINENENKDCSSITKILYQENRELKKHIRRLGDEISLFRAERGKNNIGKEVLGQNQELKAALRRYKMKCSKKLATLGFAAVIKRIITRDFCGIKSFVTLKKLPIINETNLKLGLIILSVLFKRNDINLLRSSRRNLFSRWKIRIIKEKQAIKLISILYTQKKLSPAIQHWKKSAFFKTFESFCERSKARIIKLTIRKKILQAFHTLRFLACKSKLKESQSNLKSLKLELSKLHQISDNKQYLKKQLMTSIFITKFRRIISKKLRYLIEQSGKCANLIAKQVFMLKPIICHKEKFNVYKRFNYWKHKVSEMNINDLCVLHEEQKIEKDLIIEEFDTVKTEQATNLQLNFQQNFCRSINRYAKNSICRVIKYKFMLWRRKCSEFKTTKNEFKLIFIKFKAILNKRLYMVFSNTFRSINREKFQQAAQVQSALFKKNLKIKNMIFKKWINSFRNNISARILLGKLAHGLNTKLKFIYFRKFLKAINSRKNHEMESQLSESLKENNNLLNIFEVLNQEKLSAYIDKITKILNNLSRIRQRSYLNSWVKNIKNLKSKKIGLKTLLSTIKYRIFSCYWEIFRIMLSFNGSKDRSVLNRNRSFKILIVKTVNRIRHIKGKAFNLLKENLLRKQIEFYKNDYSELISLASYSENLIKDKEKTIMSLKNSTKTNRSSLMTTISHFKASKTIAKIFKHWQQRSASIKKSIRKLFKISAYYEKRISLYALKKTANAFIISQALLLESPNDMKTHESLDFNISDPSYLLNHQKRYYYIDESKLTRLRYIEIYAKFKVKSVLAKYLGKWDMNTKKIANIYRRTHNTILRSSQGKLICWKKNEKAFGILDILVRKRFKLRELFELWKTIVKTKNASKLSVTEKGFNILAVVFKGRIQTTRIIFALWKSIINNSRRVVQSLEELSEIKEKLNDRENIIKKLIRENMSLAYKISNAKVKTKNFVKLADDIYSQEKENVIPEKKSNIPNIHNH